MPAIEPLCCLIGISASSLTKEENILLEIELFTRICEGLKEVFREHHKNYFCLMKFTMEMENAMLEENFIRLLVNDILASKEYTLEGIACYTNTHEDVMQEILAGLNSNPSAMLLRKIIELHKLVRQYPPI